MTDTRHQRIALLIPDLSSGGSERQLVELAKGLSRAGRELLIITIHESGALVAEARTIPGVRVISLRKANPVTCAWRLSRTLDRERVDLVYAFLVVAQVYALAVKWRHRQVKLVFRVGDAMRHEERLGERTVKDRLMNDLLRICAGVPDFYVLNSQAAMASKAALVSGTRIKVIPNGIDTTRFAPDPAGRAATRRALGVAASATVVGIVANFSLYKDHATFVEAARLACAEADGLHFLAIGDDRTDLGRLAHAQVHAAGLDDRVTFLGPRPDVESVLPVCDIGCSSSVTEGFSNAICELMACGAPCVVTDVGDSAVIVGDTGHTVPKSDPRSLADGLLRLIRLSPAERVDLGLRARQRIVEQFSVDRMVAATEEVLASVRMGH